VESRISPKDGSYAGNGEHYYKTGLSAIRAIDEALTEARIATVQSVLDLPCGYGRVLRCLVRRFPHAKFTACDLLRAGADFCAKMFGAEAVYSKPEMVSNTR